MVTIPIEDAQELASRTYQAFIVRGILAVLFGLLIFFMPGMALLTLIYLFGVYAIIEGVLNIAAAVRKTRARQEPWWVLLLAGVVSVIAGLLAFFMPGVTALALLYVIAAWSVVSGVLHIAAAIRIRKQVTGEWMLALSGVLSVVFGVLLVAVPGAGALAVVLWIGAYAFVIGVLQIALGIKLRRRVRGDGREPGFPTAAPSH
jgi:uncharacterized membrane protein HdeD (DUF308 family)